MEEKQKKEVNVKEEKQAMGMVWLVGILVILLVCSIVYSISLRNKLVQEQQAKVENQNSENIEQNKNDSDISKEKNEEDKDLIKITGLDDKYKELSKAALLKIYSGDKKNGATYEYDLNGDEKKEKIVLTPVDDYTYSVKCGNQTLIKELYNFYIYVVDLDENDNYLDIIVSSISDGGADTDYKIFKNIKNKFEEIKYKTNKIITGDEEGKNLYLSKTGKFFLVGDVEAYLNKAITDTYYQIEESGNVLKLNANIDDIKKVEYSILNEANFSKDKKKCNIEYAPEKVLKKGMKIKFLEWDICSDVEIIKVKLEDGTVGYLWYAYA